MAFEREARVLGRILIVLGLLPILAGCYPVRYDGPYKGRVIDADTGKPIEGVVVLGVWYKEIATAAGGVSSYYDAQETVTDANGNFNIEGKGLRLLTNIGPMHVLIFKAGYQYIGMGMWESLSIDGGLMPRKVVWEGSSAIIPLRLLTIQEREKSIGPPSPPHEAPREKIQLILREINKDRSQQGLRPIDMGN
jgi:hypothetical protein